MRNLIGELLDAYYNCLDGNITFSGSPVNIYSVGVSQDEKSHHIVLRPESETDSSNKSSFVTSPVIVMEVITVHQGAIDSSIVEQIDDLAKQLIFPTRTTTGLGTFSGGQVLNVRADNGVYLDGFDGVKHEHRKITRFSNRLNQT